MALDPLLCGKRIAPIIPREAIIESLWATKFAIQKFQGQWFLEISAELPGFEVSKLRIIGQPGKEKLEATLRTKLADPSLESGSRFLYEELADLIPHHDYAEMALCLIWCGSGGQLLALPLPWVEEQHTHCPCGARKGGCPNESLHTK